jgi:hypothetical protein
LILASGYSASQMPGISHPSVYSPHCSHTTHHAVSSPGKPVCMARLLIQSWFVTFDFDFSWDIARHPDFYLPSAYIQCSTREVTGNSSDHRSSCSFPFSSPCSVVPRVLPAEQSRTVLLRTVHQLPLLAHAQSTQALQRTKNHMEAPRPVAMNL